MANKKDQPSSDVLTMWRMSDQQYRDYLRAEEILYLDIHGVLRLTANGAPLAASSEQIDILIEELRQFKTQMQKKPE